MIRDSVGFGAVLTKVQSKAKDEEVVMQFDIRHIMEGDNQVFLSTYAAKCNQENVDLYFRYPVKWKTIQIEANYKFKVEFDEVEFEAVLKAIKVRRAFRKGSEFFTYVLSFEKEIEQDSDLHFTTYLNQKVEDQTTGKKVLQEYTVHLTPIEGYDLT